MTTVYNSDDTFNVIEDHIRQALVADTKLGSGGQMEIKTFEQEHRTDLASYNDNQLPAVSIEVGVQSLEDVAIGDLVEYQYLAHIIVVTEGGKTAALIKSDSKYYAARVARVLQQQHYPDAPMAANLPGDLDGGELGAVRVTVSNVAHDVGSSERNPNALRGLVEIFAVVAVGFQIPED